MAPCILSCKTELKKSADPLYNLIELCYSRAITDLTPPSATPAADEIWSQLQLEARTDIEEEPILRKFYTSSILSHASLESALSSHLATKLCIPDLVSRDSLRALFFDVLSDEPEIGRAVRADLLAVRDRDPACSKMVHCFLYYKGFLACQAHRVAHWLWMEQRLAVALLIQSRVSEVFAVDIHPGARIGSGVFLDHATGVVIGETAVVGDDVSILHGVTLGGTGKGGGDRHPKIGDGVLIGAGTQLLGNIVVGAGAKVGVGSVVLKPVPSRTTAVGNPARLLERKENHVRCESGRSGHRPDLLVRLCYLEFVHIPVMSICYKFV